MDLTLLKEELKKPEYQDKTDEECLNIINAKTIIVRKPISIKKLKRGMIGAGVYSDLKIAATDDSIPLKDRKPAINALALLDTYENGFVDLDNDLSKAILSDLVTANFITQNAVENLLIQVNQEIPWTESIGINKFGIGLITLARQE